MGSFTDLFIKKPVLAIVVNLLILAIGWQSIQTLPVRQYPRIESSSIIITTTYVGASADTIRGFITTPIERAVSAIDGIDYIDSTSVASVSTVTVRLRLNHPSNAALAEISARLNQVRSELPQEAESPVIEIQRTDKPYATFYISFTSENEQLNLTQLNELLEREIRPEFQTIPGVQRVNVEGPRPLAMRIWLDAAKMESLDIAPSDVWGALQRNNFVAAVGRSKSADVQIDMLTDTDLRSEDEFRELIVRQTKEIVVRLKDVARIELDSEEPTGQAGFDGKKAIWLSVWPLPRANELDVAALLKKRIAEVEPTLPPSVKMLLAYDGTYYMDHALTEITHTLIETVAIVAFIVFLFMGSLRTVIVPMLAMPVSLVGACIAMVLFGFSLNLLTILAIVLSVGLVVDDAIVMVENVERHIREGKGKIEAALVGARELFAPVVSMTITLAAVYAPIGFQGGLTGVLFREFAFALAAAVVVSGIVAVTLSPIMSAWLVPAGGQEGRLTHFVNHVFDKVRNGYLWIFDLLMPARWVLAAGAIAIGLAAVPLYNASKKELAPTEDEGVIFGYVQSSPDSSLEYTLRGFDKIADAYLKVPEKKFFFQVAQTNAGFAGIQTLDWEKREKSTAEILPELYGSLAQVSEVRAFPSLPAPLPGAGQYEVEFIVTSGEEAPLMAPYIGQIVGEAFKSGKFLYADADLKIDLPQAKIEIDKQKVADLGLDLASVGRDLAIYLSGGYVNRFNFEGRSYKVIPQVADQDRATPEQLLQFKVRTPNGGLVSMSSLVKIEMVTAPRTLTRFQQRNSAKIYGAAAPGVGKEEALQVLEAAAKKILPAGYAVDYAGESRQLRTEGASLTTTLGFALLLIYLVLAAQFSSFRDPLIILLGSVPLALSGALIFTYLGFTTVNIYSQVGLITLVGLVAKNGILIVEFANHLQEQGLSKLDAVRQAAATRLRPILMTSAATVFGHFPLVLVTGAGAKARNSIGIVLVTGMLISTIFTLLVVPAIYTIIAAKRAKTHAPGHEPATPPATGGTAHTDPQPPTAAVPA